jgi:hypothetical protein
MDKTKPGPIKEKRLIRRMVTEGCKKIDLFFTPAAYQTQSLLLLYSCFIKPYTFVCTTQIILIFPAQLLRYEIDFLMFGACTSHRT